MLTSLKFLGKWVLKKIFLLSWIKWYEHQAQEKQISVLKKWNGLETEESGKRKAEVERGRKQSQSLEKQCCKVCKNMDKDTGSCMEGLSENEDLSSLIPCYKV